MSDDASEHDCTVEDSQTVRYADGNRERLLGTIDRGGSITRRNALLGGGTLAVGTLLNHSGTVAGELWSDSVSEATTTGTQTTNEEQVQYTLTVSDSEGGNSDNAIVDHVRLGNGTVVENWSGRTLEGDYRLR
jgi:hypothetical protein